MEKQIRTIENLSVVIPNVDSIIGYGSGFSVQNGYSEDACPDLDIIVLVDEFNKWHQQNKKMNSDQYTPFTKIMLGHRSLRKDLFRNLSCSRFCYDNTNIKMMVLSKSAFLNDLKTWDKFIMAGRVQKEISLIKSSDEIKFELERNRISALITTLLLDTRDKIPLDEFYTELIRLSYMGDVRKTFHMENKNKEKNIEQGARNFFDKTYGDNELIIRDDKYVYNHHPVELIGELPSNLQKHIYDSKNLDSLEQISQTIQEYFAKKNKYNSARLAIRCFFTIGPLNGISYGIRKKDKYNNS